LTKTTFEAPSISVGAGVSVAVGSLASVVEAGGVLEGDTVFDGWMEVNVALGRWVTVGSNRVSSPALSHASRIGAKAAIPPTAANKRKNSRRFKFLQ
jgi:hypothetical protein